MFPDVTMIPTDTQLAEKAAKNGGNSVQGRSGPAPWDLVAPGMSFLGDTMLVQIAQVHDEAPKWSIYPYLRDKFLKNFWKTEPILASAIYTMQSKMRSLAYKVKAPGPRTQKRFLDLLGYAEFGRGGFSELVGKITTDMLTQDNGWFVELIGAGRPDRPLRGPVLQLAHMDASRCWRTHDPEFPVIYTNPYTGAYHKIHATRVMFGSSFTQTDELARGVGFCAVSRVLLYAQIMRDIEIYKQEKVSGRFTRAIGWGNGITPKTFNAAMEQHDEQNDALGFTRYAGIPFVFSQKDQMNLDLLDLAKLYDGFDSEKDTTQYVYVVALASGVDAREFWPATASGATKADATIQDMKAQRKGEADIVKSIELGFNWSVFPEGVELEFDQHDDQADLRSAQLQGQRISNVTQMITNGTITPQEGRAIEISQGVIEVRVLQASSNPVEGDGDAPMDLQEVVEAPPLPEPEPEDEEEQNTGSKALGTRDYGSGLYETRTDEYQRALELLLEGLADELGANPDQVDIREALDDLEDRYRSLLELGLTAAYGIGLHGTALTDIGVNRLQGVATRSGDYFHNLRNALETALVSALGVTVAETVVQSFRGRMASYAGNYWEGIWIGVGDYVSRQTKLRVARELDPKAAHCDTCPVKAKAYDSFEQMVALAGIPGDGSDRCLTNCRCILTVETAPGSGVFARLTGAPTVFTTPLVKAGRR